MNTLNCKLDNSIQILTLRYIGIGVQRVQQGASQLFRVNTLKPKVRAVFGLLLQFVGLVIIVEFFLTCFC